MELDSLLEVGVRGVRWNLVQGAAVPDAATPQVQAFFEKLRSRDLHLELHLEGPRLAKVLPSLSDQGVALVVDHFGLPTEANARADPMLAALGGVRDRKNIFFKFSAPYRTAFDRETWSGNLRQANVDSNFLVNAMEDVSCPSKLLRSEAWTFHALISRLV